MDRNLIVAVRHLDSETSGLSSCLDPEVLTYGINMEIYFSPASRLRKLEISIKLETCRLVRLALPVSEVFK